MATVTQVTRVLLGFAVLAAALHVAHAGLSLSASLVSTQTVDGQWVDVNTGNRFVCTESQGATFHCSTTLKVNANIRNYFGLVSKLASPRVYVAGGQELASNIIVYDASAFRFTLSADGKSMATCYAVTSNDPNHAFSTCNTWVKLSAVEGFAFSFGGGIPGMTCVNVNEPNDPDFWSDNYFCSINDRGLQWSTNGTIAGKNCTLVNEPNDTTSSNWNNNYMCLPSTTTIKLVWSYSGPINGKTCTRWFEPNESSAQSWDNNYLCY